MTRKRDRGFWVAHASRVLAGASSRSRTFSDASNIGASTHKRSSFRRDAETSTGDACATQAVAVATVQREFAPHEHFDRRCFSFAASAFAQDAEKRPFTFEDMMKLKRVGAPVPSPDGKWVVFDARMSIWRRIRRFRICGSCRPSGGEARRLNPTPNHEERPRFSPDGKRLIWTSKATDPTQIWMCDFEPESGGLDGEPHQVTSISTGADGGDLVAATENIVFVSSVYPGLHRMTRATSSATKSSRRAK